MNKIKSLLILLLLFVWSVTSSAQTLGTGYFSENYLYRHNINPASANEKNYVAIPFLNVNEGLRSNISLTDVLYRVNGKTVTLFHPNVNEQKVKNHISDNVRMVQDVQMQMLGGGFKAFGGYNTFAANLRALGGEKVPAAVVKDIKSGVENKQYDLSDLDANIYGYAELAFGHSHQINEHLRLGAKLKFLLGIVNFDLNVNKATVNLGKDNYTALLDADLNVSTRDIKFSHNIDENSGKEYVDFESVNHKVGVSGFGLALDLGAEYKLNNWDFSLSVLDLGFVSFGNTFKIGTNGERTLETNKYIFNVDSEASNNFEDEMERMKDDATALVKFEDMGKTSGHTRGLGLTVNAGAKYTLPSYDKLSLGLTNTTRIQGKYSWTDFRLGCSVNPIDFLNLSASLSAGTFGVGFGWMADFQIHKRFDIFVGMDTTPGAFTPQMLPLNMNMQMALGMNVMF